MTVIHNSNYFYVLNGPICSVLKVKPIKPERNTHTWTWRYHKLFFPYCKRKLWTS